MTPQSSAGTLNVIKQFRGEYRWLSNFHPFDTPATITIRGKKYEIPTAEHWYVMEKTNCDATKIHILNERSPGNVKKFGRMLDVVPNFDETKLEVMRYIVYYKYSSVSPVLKDRLLATGDEIIQEGNNWGDTYWGVCLKTGKGENNLGKLIMECRSTLTMSVKKGENLCQK